MKIQIIHYNITVYYYYLVVTIGFHLLEYEVSENHGSITLNVSILSGTLERDIVIYLSTQDDSSAGKFMETQFGN